MLIHNTALTMRGKRPNWLLGALIPTSYILGGENVMRSVDQKEFLGGQGTVHFDHVLEAEEMHGMNRVYAR